VQTVALVQAAQVLGQAKSQVKSHPETEILLVQVWPFKYIPVVHRVHIFATRPYPALQVSQTEALEHVAQVLGHVEQDSPDR